MLPYKNLIVIQRQSKQPVYLQIVESFIELIQHGRLPAKNKLPSSRALSQLIGVHRNTVSAAYEELEAQEWVEIKPQRGVFVHAKMPVVTPKALDASMKQADVPNYALVAHLHIQPPQAKNGCLYELNDGIPDIRLAPLELLGRTYRSILKRAKHKQWLDYNDPLGVLGLRMALSKYLNATRGIASESDNIFISRGSMMGLYVVAQTLLSPNDIVVVGRLNYNTANMIFKKAGGVLKTISIDEAGIVVDELEQLCLTTKIRAVYVASHHHHPTTVTLSANRRVQLLALAQQYGFAIIEDDYDYDFHYQRNPTLPLASIDGLGNVIYIGSLSKVLAPAFRVGFVVAHPALIQELGLLRRIIDRQGDVPLEKSVAELFQEGIIQRHIRKSLRIYKKRRDALCALLKQHLPSEVAFQVPSGGMALWGEFAADINLDETIYKAAEQGLFVANGYTKEMPEVNATRLGFASSSVDELEQAVLILKQSLVFQNKKN